MSTVIRYINNGSTDVVRGSHTVKAYDQIISNEFIQELDLLAGKSLQILVDGVELSADLVPANISVVEAALIRKQDTEE